MSERLILDLDKCDTCEQCTVRCGYFYRAGAEEHGMLALRERATFLLICRRCEEASCVDACPADALERRADGVLERHNLRCVSCRLCAQACPFGTIYPDLLPFYVTPCDYCIGRNGGVPSCVGSCPYDAIEYREVAPDEPDIHVLDEHLAVRSPAWRKQEVPA